MSTPTPATTRRPPHSCGADEAGLDLVGVPDHPYSRSLLDTLSFIAALVRRTNLLGRHFKPLLKRAWLPPIRLYDLGHTCATILLMAGKHPKYVQELLGHASISITLDTYSHVIKGMDGGLADAMDEAL